MKHSNRITNYLIALFFIAQVVGLLVIFNYVDLSKSIEQGEVVQSNTPVGENADIAEDSAFFVILGGILIGTALVFAIIYFKLFQLWRVWFLVAVAFCLSIAYGAFLYKNPNIWIAQYLPLALGLITAIWKVYKPNFYIHNFTEIFLYGGLVQFFIGSINLWTAFAIMVAISIYDIYAVHHSKHMIKLANSQTESGIFAGLMIPYSTQEKDFYKSFKSKQTTDSAAVSTKSNVAAVKPADDKIGKSIAGKSAILGGGDIGFALLFAGAILFDKLHGLISLRNAGELIGSLDVAIKMMLLKILVIPLCATIALYILFVKSRADKFYPAMPFITGGCFVGYVLFSLLA